MSERGRDDHHRSRSRSPGRREREYRRDDRDGRDRDRDRERDRGRSSRDDRDRGRDERRGEREEPRREERKGYVRTRIDLRKAPLTQDSSRSPERPKLQRPKSSMWDKAPTGYEGMNVAQVAKINPAALMPLMQPGSSLASSRQSRRLYIGNLPANINEQQLAEFFNTAMITAKVTQKAGNPVVTVQMNKDKGFAFIEFRSPDDATAGIAFDGIILQGNALKVRRPKDYAGAVGEKGYADEDDWAEPETHIPGIVSTDVRDSENKVFVGGLPGVMTEDQVKELVSGYGQLRAFNLVKDAQGHSRGYAFLEFLDTSVTDRVCATLNGFKIGDKSLVVQRAQTRAKNAEAKRPPVSTEHAVSNPTAINFLTLGLPVPTIVGGLGAAQEPSTVLNLLNCFAVEDLTADQDYLDLWQDLHDEARKHGRLLAVVVPRPPKGAAKIDPYAPPLPQSAPDASPEAMEAMRTAPGEGVGRVFVEYATMQEAQAAQLAFTGRKFNRRTIVTAWYPARLFKAGRYDGPPADETNEFPKGFGPRSVQHQAQLQQAQAALQGSQPQPQASV